MDGPGRGHEPPVEPGSPGYGYGENGPPEVVLDWPANAAQIALWLIVLGIWAVWGWVELRGDSCWKCGRDKGLCKHTRETRDSDQT